MPLLEVRGLRKRFFGIDALRAVDLHVDAGEIVGLIGPNGSGKTTLFNCVTGQHPVDGGTVSYRGHDITGRPPFHIALGRLGRTFQMVQVYPRLTVIENLLVALQEHQERNPLARVLRLPTVRRSEAAAQARARALVQEFTLARLQDAPAGTLSYGQRKLLEFAAVLMAEPELILLDEPTAAVNPTMIEHMKRHVRRLHGVGTTFLIVEHNMSVVMDLCQRVVVLDHGEKVAEGTPAEIQANPRVIEAYFGR
jgi:ABC-type branched-subunit amino acid transport system ATPase component